MSKRAFEVTMMAAGAATPISLGVAWAEDEEAAMKAALRRELGQGSEEGWSVYMVRMSAQPRPELEEAKPRQFVVMLDASSSVEYVGTYKCLHADAAKACALEEEVFATQDLATVAASLKVIGIDHELRIDPEYYERVQDGSKTFEIRRNDRNYLEGQVVMLREWRRDGIEGGKRYSGREHVARIGYVADYKQQPGYVVFSLASIL